MIELVIAACLVSGDCRDFSLLYDQREVSVMTCLMAGQPEVARWQLGHPGWEVAGWSCGVLDNRTAADL